MYKNQYNIYIGFLFYIDSNYLFINIFYMNKIQKIIKSTLLEYLNEGFSDEVQYKTETHMKIV